MKASDLKIIDDDINDYISRNSVPGLSLAITQNERLVFAKGFGAANPTSGRIVTPYSFFRMMFISKSITAAAIMKFEQEGVFKLNRTVFGPGSLAGDKYGDWVAFVEGKRQHNANITSITVWQDLLEHVSGWGKVFQLRSRRPPFKVGYDTRTGRFGHCSERSTRTRSQNGLRVCQLWLPRARPPSSRSRRQLVLRELR